MTFNEYQKQSRRTALYPRELNLVYPTLGLTGEAGEVAEKIKKIIRDEEGRISNEKKKELVKEMGDVLWYLAQLATELGVSLDEVATINIRKLSSRQARGKIKGSGDNR